MIVLTSTDILALITSAATAVDVAVSFADNAAASFTPGRQATTIAAAATTTILGAPAATVTRNVSNASVFARGGANTVTVVLNTGSAFQEISVALATGERLEYENGAGWRVLDVSGNFKTAVSTGTPGHVIKVNSAGFIQRAALDFLNTTDLTFTGTDNGGLGETQITAAFTTVSTLGGRLLRAPQIVTATNAAFAHPTGTKALVVEGCGGGGAGGGAAAVAGAVGSGGNSANWGRKTFTSISGTSNITIGANGTGVSGSAGNNGGNSSFVHNAVTLTLPGGLGGTILAGAATIAAATVNAANAASTGADIDTVGERGYPGWRCSAAATSTISGSGGSNPLGAGGVAQQFLAGAGVAGTGHGSGGSGGSAPAAVAVAGGAGTSGAFIIWEFG